MDTFKYVWMIVVEYYDHYAATDRTFAVRRVFRTKEGAERFAKENPEEVPDLKKATFLQVEVT